MSIDWGTLTPDDLPDEFAEVARTIGMEATRKLIEGWAGVRLYVPALGDVRREQLAHRAHALLEDGKRKPAAGRDLGITGAKLNTLVARSANEGRPTRSAAGSRGEVRGSARTRSASHRGSRS